MPPDSAGCRRVATAARRGPLCHHRGHRVRVDRRGDGHADRGAGPERAALLRLVLLTVPDRHVARDRGVGAAVRPDRAGQAAAGRPGRLRGRTGAGRHSWHHDSAGRWSSGPGSRRWCDQHGDLRLCRADLRAGPAAAGVHLHLDGLGGAVLRRPADLGLADPQPELALGVLRRAAAGRGGRRHARAVAAAADPHASAARGVGRSSRSPSWPPAWWRSGPLPSRPPVSASI